MTPSAYNGLQGGDSMTAKKVELESMSLDDLWSLHEKISAILSTRIKAEKHELEKRLAVLNGGNDVISHSGASRSLQNGKARRKYPRVLPKYRNPQTSETWSGRGKRPLWLVAAMKSGRKIEEFRIGDGGPKGRQRA
jgi:DNA-binding protein H-NS